MSEEHFYRAILDEPAEDLHRMVYADWLEEHDQPERAEFIRLQLALANRGPYKPPAELMGIATSNRLYNYAAITLLIELENAYNEQTAALKAREQELLEKYKDQWLANSKGLLDVWTLDEPVVVDYVYGLMGLFRRGFVSKVVCSSHNWWCYGPEIIYQYPIEEVSLTGKEPTRYYRTSGPSNPVMTPEAYGWIRQSDVQEEEDTPNTFLAATLLECYWGYLKDDIVSVDQTTISGTPRPQRKFYKTSSDAYRALGDACIRWARDFKKDVENIRTHYKGFGTRISFPSP